MRRYLITMSDGSQLSAFGYGRNEAIRNAIRFEGYSFSDVKLITTTL